MGELRRHERRKIELKAIVKGTDAAGQMFARDARIVNLSRGGAYLIAHGDLPSRDAVELFLWFGNPDDPGSTPQVSPTPSRVVRVEPVMVSDAVVGSVMPRLGVAVRFERELDVV